VSVFTLVSVDECGEDDELLLRELLVRHGYDQDHRPHVCELDGVPVEATSPVPLAGASTAARPGRSGRLGR
jgi:hypothetical protein